MMRRRLHALAAIAALTVAACQSPPVPSPLTGESRWLCCNLHYEKPEITDVNSLGYPPAHRTPSLESPTWTYWQNRWSTFVVAFDGETVSRVAR